MFYQKIYLAPFNKSDNDIFEKLSGYNFNKLTDEEAQELAGLITYSEAFNFLKHMKNNKSSGSDGFTVEIFFSVDLGHVIIKVINYNYSVGEISFVKKIRNYHMHTKTI